MTRVLIVEDEESLAEPLAYLLNKEGFDTTVMADGPSALAEFDRAGADIVLLDLMLPGMSGTDVCKQLRARSGVPVIMVTARDSEIDKVVGLELGADHAIDYSTQDLEAEVMRITEGQGVQVLYDNIANPKALPKAFKAIGQDGRMVTAGAHGGPVAPIDFHHLYDKRITIKGMPGYKPSDLPLCFAAAAEGKIRVRIAHILPLSQAPEAHRLMESDPGMGKIVLDPTLG